MRISIIALSTALATVSPAYAQVSEETTGWTPDQIVVTGERANYGEAAATTATRTDTPVEKVPQSIQTITRALIEDQDQRTLTDALVNVSGVTPTSTEQSVLQPSLIRGFSVSYYFDGVPSYQLPSSVADPGTLVNVERIEVAKGPTATLYGGGSGAPLSGIINLVSRMPGDEFSASIAARAGSFDTYGADIGLNIPFAPGIGLRVDGSIETSDSFVDFVSRDRRSIFPTLAAELDSKTTLVVRGRYGKIEQTEYAGIPYELLDPTRLIDKNVYAGARDMPRTWTENKGITATLTHRFSDAVEASATVNRGITRFEEWGSFPYGQIAGTVYNFGTAYLPSNSKKSYATVQITAHVGPQDFHHTLLAGIDYDRTIYFGAMYFNPAWAVIDYASPLPAPSFGGNPPFFFDQNDRLRTIAGFVQDQIAIGDRIDLTAGLRWTRLTVDSIAAGGVANTTDEKVTPRIGATVRVAKGVSLFGGYSEGFQGVVAGGFYGVVPKPETSQAWEAGFKFANPIPGLSGTLSLYRITRQNVLTANPAIPFTYIQAGEQRAKGVELDFIYEPAPSLSILASYGYTDAKISKDNTLPVGDQLRAVPKHSGRIAARYRFRDGALKGFEFGGGITAVSRRELTMPNTLSVSGFAVVDAQASYDLGPVTLSVSARNLLGANAFEPYQYFGGTYVIPTQPRSAFVTLKGDF